MLVITEKRLVVKNINDQNYFTLTVRSVQSSGVDCQNCAVGGWWMKVNDKGLLWRF